MLTADSRVGTNIGPYRVDGLLGVGGMGKVYSAVGPDGVRVALKVVKEDLARDETFRKRFAREARIAQTVRNPHVVEVLDTGEHEGLPYMAARLIEGQSLEEKLRDEGRLDLPTAVHICAQVALGLQALWAAGMVHRDVKPGNILLDDEGNAYVTDFGLAKDSQGSVLTLPGQALGSMDYMAPEQIRGEAVTAETDLYSLGCVMFECLQGLPPFADRQGMRVLWAHLQDEPANPSGVSEQVGVAIKSALQKSPEDRPKSGTEYANKLSLAAGIPMADVA
ncbi:MAG: serine/threonine-protein kinase [Solirubrobacteraceae bacterium]